jgi:sugar lactone lactonase YvrE
MSEGRVQRAGRLLIGDLAFGESPRWHEGRLWLADWGAQEIVAVDLDGGSEVMARVEFPSFPLSFDWLPDGPLLIVAAREGRLLRQQPGGALVSHAELTDLAPKGVPWNEIVVDGRGNVYVNNNGFDLMTGAEFAPGTIALLTPDGSVRQVADGIAFPNGMAVTPDNSTLIVAESYASKLTAFEIAADGTLSHRRTWAELPGDHPDGICLDADGAVWYGDVGNKHCVRVGEGGAVLETVELDRGCFACMLGGADRRTLFIVATEWHGPEKTAEGPRTGQVLTVEAPVPGVGWP